jgi:hypothetical protein
VPCRINPNENRREKRVSRWSFCCSIRSWYTASHCSVLHSTEYSTLPDRPTYLRASRASAAVLKSMGTMDLTISLSFNTLASEIPLTSESLRIVEWATCCCYSFKEKEYVRIVIALTTVVS